VTERLKVEAWTQTDELLAMTVEQLSALFVVTVNANSKRRTDLKPIEIPRPNRPKPEAPVVSPQEAARRTGGSVA
jgi:hypothetical protein